MNETMSINIDNLRLFVGALREVVDTLPEAEHVNMMSTMRPSCGTPGCHAGLAMLALDRLGVPSGPFGNRYSFSLQANRLSYYLMGMDPDEMIDDPMERPVIAKWAHDNPDDWGCKYGLGMFSSGDAFNKYSDVFPSTVIANWWAAVLARLEKKP